MPPFHLSRSLNRAKVESVPWQYKFWAWFARVRDWFWHPYHYDERIEREVVLLDCKTYVNCTFVSCTLIYGGGALEVVDCDIERCDLQLVGRALATAQVLESLGVVTHGWEMVGHQ